MRSWCCYLNTDGSRSPPSSAWWAASPSQAAPPNTAGFQSPPSLPSTSASCRPGGERAPSLLLCDGEDGKGVDRREEFLYYHYSTWLTQGFIKGAGGRQLWNDKLLYQTGCGQIPTQPAGGGWVCAACQKYQDVPFTAVLDILTHNPLHWFITLTMWDLVNQ